MKFFGGNYGEDRFWATVDKTNYDVCHFGSLCNFGEQGTYKKDYSNSGSLSRQSYISRLVPLVCRGVELFIIMS